MSYLLRSCLVIGTMFLLCITGWLAFLRYDESDAFLITFASTRTGTSQIYVMSANGSSVRQLSNLPDTGFWNTWYSYPHWNAAADCIAFDLTPFDNLSLQDYCVDFVGETVAAWDEFQGEVLQPFSSMSARMYVTRDNVRWHVGTSIDHGVFRMRLDGSDFVQLSPVWGHTLKYYETSDLIQFHDDSGKTYLVNFDAAYSIVLNGRAIDVHVSPDREWIVYELEYDQQFQGRLQRFYYVLKQDTTNIFPITVYRDRPPIWSSDSRYLIYEAFDGLRSFDTHSLREYLLVGIDDKMRSKGYLAPDFYDYRWSPDGELLAIKLYKDIFIVRPDGTFIQNLTAHSLVESPQLLTCGYKYNHVNARWSPDGKWIVFQSDLRHKTSDIFKIRPDGSEIEKITNDPNWDVMPSWIPSFEKKWHPELALAGGLITLVGVVLLSVFRRKQTL